MTRRISPLLLVLCLAIASPLFASPRGPKQMQRAPQVVQATGAGERVGRFWQQLTILWGAAGCILDPNGAKCAAAPTGHAVVAPPAPQGCITDPNGCR